MGAIGAAGDFVAAAADADRALRRRRLLSASAWRRPAASSALIPVSRLTGFMPEQLALLHQLIAVTAQFFANSCTRIACSISYSAAGGSVAPCSRRGDGGPDG